MADLPRIFQGTEIALPGSATLGFSASIWVIDARLLKPLTGDMRLVLVLKSRLPG